MYYVPQTRSRSNTPNRTDAAPASERRRKIWYCREFYEKGTCKSGKPHGESCPEGPHRTKEDVEKFAKANPDAVPMPKILPKAKPGSKAKAKPKPKQ